VLLKRFGLVSLPRARSEDLQFVLKVTDPSLGEKKGSIIWFIIYLPEEPNRWLYYRFPTRNGRIYWMYRTLSPSSDSDTPLRLSHNELRLLLAELRISTTRETIEREAPADSWNRGEWGRMTGVLPWLIRSARCAGTRDFGPVLVAVIDHVQNMFFLTVHYFSSFVPIAQQTSMLGTQSCWVTCLLMCVSVHYWITPTVSHPY